MSPPPMMMTCLSFAVMNRVVGGSSSPSQRRFCCGQVLHREVDALQLAAGHRQIARRASRRRRGRSRRSRARSSSTDTFDADVGAGAERRRLPRCISVEAAIEEPLLQLELGNAVAQQPADAIGALEDGDRVAGAIQLIGGGEARRPRADDRDALAGARRRAAAA